MQYITCLFLKEGITQKEPSPLSGVDYHTLESGLDFVKEYVSKGITHFLIFGSTHNKSVDFACKDGLIKKFIEIAKANFGSSICIHADVGLSPYSSDGHSTVLGDDNQINYIQSYNLASQLAIAFASAGADYVAPCLSLPDQVKEIRRALDGAHLTDTKIHAYSAKFASCLYGPYRQTIQSPLRGNNIKFYQTDYADADTALQQILIDEKQGASIVMVKPAMLYMDIVYRAKSMSTLPLSAYHVSGEYAMIKEASARGVLEENSCFDEVHSAFYRCGVNFIIGYAPEHFLRWANAKKLA